jgi:hypothetical protein
MRDLIRSGAGAMLLLLIMFLGSLGLWLGTPLLWLWIGSQVQGETASVGGALAVMFVGVVASVAAVAVVLVKLSEVYRSNRLARGRHDPGHIVLESVLVVSATCTVLGFVVWFFFLAGASPVPLGMNF